MKPAQDIATRFLRRENKELRKHLRDLTQTVEQVLDALDREMKRPSSPERGERIAKISNALELQKDLAVRYGLGEDRFKRKG